MGITLSKMAANTATVTFPYMGDSVNVTYTPGKINDAVIDKLDGTTEQCTEALSQIITSWDVMDDSVDPAVMVPVDAEHMKDLGWPFRLAVRQAIVRDMRPNTGAPQA